VSFSVYFFFTIMSYSSCPGRFPVIPSLMDTICTKVETPCFSCIPPLTPTSPPGDISPTSLYDDSESDTIPDDDAWELLSDEIPDPLTKYTSYASPSSGEVFASRAQHTAKKFIGSRGGLYPLSIPLPCADPFQS
jgi:hypothetical protein